ncbi:hypothetical protein PG993_007271 [Apiospora rasikravindrae]|uniref:Uncharacterized protein n=1 Tax=Apiospora rasikravindrae TaxID=990691 RepID=A0ABR1SX29_9PEZI
MKVPQEHLPESVYDRMGMWPLPPPASPPASPSPPAPSTPPSGLGVRFNDDPGYQADEEGGGSERTHNSTPAVRLGEVARGLPQIITHVSPRPLSQRGEYSVVVEARRGV